MATDLVSFKLERGDLVVSQLFRMFDSARATSGILDWGIKMTTLEDGGCTNLISVPFHSLFFSPRALISQTLRHYMKFSLSLSL